jgi:hypothetical protein
MRHRQNYYARQAELLFTAPNSSLYCINTKDVSPHFYMLFLAHSTYLYHKETTCYILQRHDNEVCMCVCVSVCVCVCVCFYMTA